MKQYIYYITSIAFFLFIYVSSSGQVATNDQQGADKPSFPLKNRYKSDTQFISPPCLDKTLSLIIHIVLDSLGQANITEEKMIEAVDTMNNHFKPICLRFKICEFRYIHNFQYDSLYCEIEEPELLTLHYVKNNINIYVVSDIKRNDNQSDACGYAYSPGGPDVIVLKKSCLTPITSRFLFSHEMGHFFGLLHTFQNPGELVDGSNCQTTGDFICDTEADPNTIADLTCNMKYPWLKDANDDYYMPPTDNIMSYYPENCICCFSPEQFKKMAEIYLTKRNYLW